MRARAVAAPLAAAAAILAVAGCARQAPPAPPAFDPLAFFTGHLHSDGVLTLVWSRPETFGTDIHGTPEPGGALLLQQHFTFADGHTEDRVWHLRQDGPGRITGRAGDVVGTAHGQVNGTTLRLRYGLDTAPGDWLRRVWMDQTMTVQPDGTMANRVRITKLGLPIGRVTERFTHLPGGSGQDGGGG